MALTAAARTSPPGVDLSWATVAGCTYRAYYRRNGTSTWYLYADALAATSLNAIDHLALGVAYDFAVSAVSATPAEGAKTAAQTATVPVGAYHWLHIAGQGMTYASPLAIPDGVEYPETIDVDRLLGYARAAPSSLYGGADYLEFSIEPWFQDATAASMRTLKAVLDQMKLGSSAFYRNTTGGMLTVGLGPDQSVTVSPPRLREYKLKLQEVPDLVGPYVAAGSALGIRTLIDGRLPALDPSERML